MNPGMDICFEVFGLTKIIELSHANYQKEISFEVRLRDFFLYIAATKSSKFSVQDTKTIHIHGKGCDLSVVFIVFNKMILKNGKKQNIRQSFQIFFFNFVLYCTFSS